MKLKTLKDLKKYRRTGLKEGINVKELRREAIKWVKIGNQIEGCCDRNVNNFIIHFFNITEEDLK